MGVKKDIPIDQIVRLYQKHASVHVVGNLLGVCGQTIKNKLDKAGICLNRRPWTDQEKLLVSNYYKGTDPSAFSIKKLADSLGRSFASVALIASRIGCARPRTAAKVFSDEHKRHISEGQLLRISKLDVKPIPKHLIEYVKIHGSPFKGKKHSSAYRIMQSIRAREWHKTHPHPRGMLGRHHTQETKDAISKFHTGKPQPPERTLAAMRTKLARFGTLAPRLGRPGSTWKQGWREIAGNRIFFRSRWEFNYALYLELMREHKQISSWEHEPQTFWFEQIKRGCRSYLPDFRVIKNDRSVEYHEVKGWMDARSVTKLKRMAKYYPDIKLIVIDGSWFKRNTRTLSAIIKNWER